MFSLLQRHILKECFGRKGEKIGRKFFNTFYLEKKIYPVKSPAGRPPTAEFNRVKTKDQVNTITKCLERLIDKGLLIGYGTRTPKKWFIREVKLTKLGIKKYVEWLGNRQSKMKF